GGRRDDRMCMVGPSLGVERVPDGERDAEVALAADAPVHLEVLGPVPVAQAHEVRMPADLVALGEERVLLVEEPHEPLARRNELEGAVALLVELDRVLDRPRLAAEWRVRLAGRAARAVAKLLDDRLPRGLHRLAGQRGVPAVGRTAIHAL